MPRISVHPAIKRHLANYGVSTEEETENYLFPKLKDLPSPFLLKSIDTAVELIISAISNKEDILIWGDYDVDGITGTSLLYTFFKQIGVTPKYHIPNRLTEGYGLNSTVLRDYATKLTENKLLITVDCGISNGEELVLAKTYGFKTIVTDHHQVPDSMPQADATINPKQQDCQFPFNDLSGVGVAFYLAAALRNKIVNTDLLRTSYIPNMKSFLDFVAIGTIADIMPLKGVNRILVKGGFESISASSHRGIRNLFTTLDINSELLTSDAVSFRIAPAINAAGRLGEAEKPLKLFLAETDASASEFSSQLVQLNNRRREITEQNYSDALDITRKELLKCNKCVVIIGEFHEGVLGIVASRLVEEFRIPALVCCYHPADRTIVKGSGRAPEGLNLYKLISGAELFLQNFGGHEAAAGFSLPAANFMQFKDKLYTLISSFKGILSSDSISIENKYIELSLSEALDPTLLDNLRHMEPTGEANPKPTFIDRQARFVSYSTFGKNRAHLKGIIRGKYNNIPVTGFNLATKQREINLGEKCTVLFNHGVDYYNGRTKWRVYLKDILPG
ncbi:MAG: single-stranded-DNA-specific exonuclease RecJ [Desulfofustis sp.]|nr:single-stranded-DNA-specific exonuclease RecJ [Desulfofustis sp.]